MSICTVQLPIVRIFKDFDRMSANEQQITTKHSTGVNSNNRNTITTIDDGAASDEQCVINFIDTKNEEQDGTVSSNEEDAAATTTTLSHITKPLRQRKRSTSNSPYKMSKAFSDSHSLCRNCDSNPCLAKRSNTMATSANDNSNLRKRIVSSGLSTGYAQYQMDLLEVPMPRDYGDASSDDLSSEWDSDVQETHRSPKVFILFLFFFFRLFSLFNDIFSNRFNKCALVGCGNFELSNVILIRNHFFLMFFDFFHAGNLIGIRTET